MVFLNKHQRKFSRKMFLYCAIKIQLGKKVKISVFFDTLKRFNEFATSHLNPDVWNVLEKFNYLSSSSRYDELIMRLCK